MKNKVEYGADEFDGKHRPFIEIFLSTGVSVKFSANAIFDDIKAAKEVSMRAYMILSGKQSNTKYSESGDA